MRRLCVCGWLLLVIAGCSSKDVTRLTGTVTLDGQPLAGFQVVLINADQNRGGVGGAFIKADGAYEIKNVRPGGYKVIIDRYRGPMAPGASPPAGPDRLPPRYSDPNQTELTADLEQDKTTTRDFVLTSNP